MYLRLITTNNKMTNRWDDEQEKILMNGLMKGKSFAKLMLELQGRSESALEMRASKISRDEMKKTGKSTEAVLDKYGITLDVYKRSLEKMEAKKPESKKETMISLTKKVNDLKEESKINKETINSLTNSVNELREESKENREIITSMSKMFDTLKEEMRELQSKIKKLDTGKKHSKK